jgi:uracil-DNA glycosylase family 4
VRFLPGGIAFMMDMPVADADHSSGEPLAGGRQEVRMLEQILERAGLEREELLLLYRVRCAPQRGRITDHPEASFNCDVHTEAELSAYDPSVVLLAGTALLPEVYDAKSRITTMHSKPRTTGPKFKWGQRTFIGTYHPYAAVKNPGLQRSMVKDFTIAKEIRDDQS